MDLTLNKIDRILRKINFDREIAKTDDPYSESLPLQAVFSLTETPVVHLPFRHIK